MWHILSLSHPFTDPNSYILAKRFGLCQDDLVQLLAAGGINLATAECKTWTSAILKATGMSVAVYKTKSGPHNINGASGIRFKCATPAMA